MAARGSGRGVVGAVAALVAAALVAAGATGLVAGATGGPAPAAAPVAPAGVAAPPLRPPIGPGRVPEPGEVGFRGDPAALAVIDGPASAPPGTRWSDGVLSVTGADVVLDRVYVRGGIDVAGTGTLTIRDSIVEATPAAHATVLARGGHLDIRDSTLRRRGGAPGPGWGTGVVHGDATMTILRCDLSGSPDGVQNAAGRSVLEQNHIHDLAMLGSSAADATHNDGVQSYGGPDLAIRYNRIDLRDARGRAYDGLHQNAAVFVQPGASHPSTGLQLVGNSLAGGGYTLRLEAPVTGAVVTGNRFGPTTGGFGDVLVDPAGVRIARWADNTDAAGRELAHPAP